MLHTKCYIIDEVFIFVIMIDYYTYIFIYIFISEPPFGDAEILYLLNI